MPGKRKVAVYPDDKTEVIYETSAKWDTAGMVLNRNGSWGLAAHGFSPDSVRRRTIAYANRTTATDIIGWCVTPIYEVTAPIVREYFGSHRVRIASAFYPGEGWRNVSEPASRAAIRRLIAGGAGSLMFRLPSNDRSADFAAEELIASLRARKPREGK